jgi:hypothetical protein
VLFEIVDYRHMCEIAAYGGFPTRYPHWRFGMEYDHMLKSHTYGLSKIYELVINTNPCYAYLLEGNNLVDQKLVMAHVYGHCDFFKNNYFFSQDRPADDRRDGEQRLARAPLHGPPRRLHRSSLHRRVPVARQPHRPLAAVSRAKARRPPVGAKRDSPS